MNNKQKLLKVLNQAYESDRLYDFIQTEVKEQYVSNYINGGLVGYVNKICIDTEGNLSITGPIKYEVKTPGEENGSQLKLFTVPNYLKNDFEITEHEIMDLNEYQTADLYSLLENEVNDDYKREYPDIYSFLTPYAYPVLEEKFKQLFPDRYDFLLNEHAENSFCWGLEDGYTDQIDYIRSTLEAELRPNIEIGNMPF